MLNFILGVLATLVTLVLLASFDLNLPFLATVSNNITFLQAAGSLAIAASAVVAFSLYRLNVKRNDAEDQYNASREFLNESISLLERSFEIFTDGGENTDPPRNDRFLWLTTARMLVRFDAMKSKITAAEHLDKSEAHEEYWRIKFQRLVYDNTKHFGTEYFGKPYAGDAIERNSIAVIYNFCRWKEGAPDPMDDVDGQMLIAKGAIPIDQFGLIGFLEGYEEWWAKAQEMKKELKDENDT